MCVLSRSCVWRGARTVVSKPTARQRGDSPVRSSLIGLSNGACGASSSSSSSSSSSAAFLPQLSAEVAAHEEAQKAFRLERGRCQQLELDKLCLLERIQCLGGGGAHTPDKQRESPMRGGRILACGSPSSLKESRESPEEGWDRNDGLVRCTSSPNAGSRQRHADPTYCASDNGEVECVLQWEAQAGDDREPAVRWGDSIPHSLLFVMILVKASRHSVRVLSFRSPGCSCPHGLALTDVSVELHFCPLRSVSLFGSWYRRGGR